MNITIFSNIIHLDITNLTPKCMNITISISQCNWSGWITTNDFKVITHKNWSRLMYFNKVFKDLGTFFKRTPWERYTMSMYVTFKLLKIWQESHLLSFKIRSAHTLFSIRIISSNYMKLFSWVKCHTFCATSIQLHICLI
jgi:hypothetical protein